MFVVDLFIGTRVMFAMFEPTGRRVLFISPLASQRDSSMSAKAIGLGDVHRHEREPQRGGPH